MTVSWGRRLTASVLVALTVALVTHVANLLAFLVSAQMQATNLPVVSTYFLRGTLVVFVIVFAGALLGALRYRLAAYGLGLLAGIVGALVSTSINAAEQGAPIGAETFGALFGTLIGLNTIFVLVAAIATGTLGVVLYRTIVSADAVTGTRGRRIALVRMPSSKFAASGTSDVNSETADKQWEAYVEALEAAGWETSEVAFAEDSPESVLVQDSVVILGDTAIITRPAEERRIETDAVERTVADLGLRLERIMNPATLDGGDVVVAGSTVYVGRSERTNAEGVKQLRAIAAPLGYSVVAVPTTVATGLASVVSALPDGSILTHPEISPERNFFSRSYTVPERAGAAVIALDDFTILMSSSAPQTAEFLTDLGYTVIAVDLSEFEKLGATAARISARVS